MDIVKHLNELRQKSLCSKLKVSAFITNNKNGKIIGEGVNYSDDIKSCTNEIKDSTNGKTSDIIHAEVACLNSVITKKDLGTMYVSHSPCLSCAKAIVAAGVKKLVYITPFKSFAGINYLLNNNVSVDTIEDDIFGNDKVIMTSSYTILKKLDKDVQRDSGLIVDTSTANLVEEVCEVVASTIFDKGANLLIKMNATLWLDQRMKYFVIPNEDIQMEIKGEKVA